VDATEIRSTKENVILHPISSKSPRHPSLWSLSILAIWYCCFSESLLSDHRMNNGLVLGRLRAAAFADNDVISSTRVE
jgi:hypothetical protein